MWIDSHCHLSHPIIKEKGDTDLIISQANDAGVSGMLNVCCRISHEMDNLLDISNSHDNVWCSIGTHPHDAGLEAEKAISQADIIKIANSSDKIIAIGESGLDYYYDNSPRDEQQASFRKHTRAAIETGLPIIIHTRDAEEDTINIMRDYSELTGVMHCFSGSQDLAAKALDMGFYISFSGIITFKKADELRETAKIVPLDRVLIETDAPFLAPVPYRGKVNQPAYVAKIGEFLADIYEVEVEEFARITTDNFHRLFFSC